MGYYIPLSIRITSSLVFSKLNENGYAFLMAPFISQIASSRTKHFYCTFTYRIAQFCRNCISLLRMRTLYFFFSIFVCAQAFPLFFPMLPLLHISPFFFLLCTSSLLMHAPLYASPLYSCMISSSLSQTLTSILFCFLLFGVSPFSAFYFPFNKLHRSVTDD